MAGLGWRGVQGDASSEIAAVLAVVVGGSVVGGGLVARQSNEPNERMI